MIKRLNTKRCVISHLAETLIPSQKHLYVVIKVIPKLINVAEVKEVRGFHPDNDPRMRSKEATDFGYAQSRNTASPECVKCANT